jgi:hypothetical protein
MQEVVQSLRAGDRIYISAWFFDPSAERTHGLHTVRPFGGELLARRANAGVVIRIAGHERSRRAHTRRAPPAPYDRGLLNGQGIADN